MEETKLGVIESRFADLIWAHAPLTSGELVKLCQEELTWKKSTTYTVLKKLCDRCCFANKLRKIFIQSAKKKRRLKGF